MKDYRRAAVQFDIIILGNVDLPKGSKKKGKVSLQVRPDLSTPFLILIAESPTRTPA